MQCGVRWLEAKRRVSMAAAGIWSFAQIMRSAATDL
jgi:hypothetical protein